jgi:predicted nucleic acid-binding protein
MILIDTGPLVAVCDARDGKRRTALKHLQLLATHPFVTCDAVLTEACFHLPHPAQRQRLGALLRELHVEALPAVQDSRFWSDVFRWLTKYADHEPDWADACLAVLSGYDRNVVIWTYDSEFRRTWRRLDGTAVPLAVT